MVLINFISLAKLNLTIRSKIAFYFDMAKLYTLFIQYSILGGVNLCPEFFEVRNKIITFAMYETTTIYYRHSVAFGCNIMRRILIR